MDFDLGVNIGSSNLARLLHRRRQQARRYESVEPASQAAFQQRGARNDPDILKITEDWSVVTGSDLDFERIYGAYHGKVRAYAAKLLGNADADDVSQEVFAKIHRSVARLSDPARLPGWIHAVTLNTVRDLVRKRTRGPVANVPADPLDEEGDEGDPSVSRIPDLTSRTPEERAERAEMVACYLGYLKKLPPAHYRVYVLSEFEDLPNEEIARQLGLSLATVKMRLHRARSRLNSELRRNCRCYYNERGELMGEPKGPDQDTPRCNAPKTPIRR
jgi:RNA polymerase sigma-70 factor (ECF subfamily)